MIASSVVGRAQLFLNDTGGVRWNGTAMLQYLADALNELWVRRQSAFYTSGIVYTQPSNPSSAGDTVYIQDSYLLPVAHYISYLCFLEDSDDVSNTSLATMHYNLFEKGLL